MMSEPLEMTLQERMVILSFVSKSVEMLETPLPPNNIANLQQWKALAEDAKKVLVKLDADWPAMLPLPHDGISWSER
jgi:hypothetical protein